MSVQNLADLKTAITTRVNDNTTGDITPAEVRGLLTDMADSLNGIRQMPRGTTICSWYAGGTTVYGGSIDAQNLSITSTNYSNAAGHAGNCRLKHTGSAVAGGTVGAAFGAWGTYPSLTTANYGRRIDIVGQFVIRNITPGAGRLYIGLAPFGVAVPANGCGIRITDAQIQAFHVSDSVFTFGAEHSVSPVTGKFYDFATSFDVATRSITSFSINGVSGAVPTTGQPAVFNCQPGVWMERVTAVDNLMFVDFYNTYKINYA